MTAVILRMILMMKTAVVDLLTLLPRRASSNC